MFFGRVALPFRPSHIGPPLADRKALRGCRYHLSRRLHLPHPRAHGRKL